MIIFLLMSIKIFRYKDLICVRDFLNVVMQRLLQLVMIGSPYLSLVVLR